MTEHYGSGTWQVTPGREEEFVERWSEFITWSRKNHPEMIVATLLRDRNLKGHFVSFAEWADPEARAAWKQSPDFNIRFGACAELCDHMSGSDYDRVVTV